MNIHKLPNKKTHIYFTCFILCSLQRSAAETATQKHISEPASEPTYEPFDLEVYSNLKTDDDDMLDNLAYGRVDTLPEGAEHQFFDDTILELKDNASYGSVTSMPVCDDGEYSYPTTNFEPVQIRDIYS